MSSLSMPYGLRRLLDYNQQVFAEGLPTFYVVQNFNPSQYSFLALGLSAPSVTGATITGGLQPDVTILPRPNVGKVNIRNGPNQEGTVQRIATRLFTISHTWVQATQQQRNFPDFKSVFYDQSVLGLRYDNLLHKIISADPGSTAGGIVSWDVTCTVPL